MERFLIKLDPPTYLCKPQLHWHAEQQVTGRKTLRSAWARFLHLYMQLGSFPQSALSTTFPPPPNTPGWFNRNQNGGELSTWGEIWDTVQDGTHVVAQRPYVSSVEMDSRGELLASTSSIGCITLHEYDQARACLSQNDAQAPLVSLSTRLRLEKVSWNPANENQVAVCASGTANLSIYDLSVISNEPKELLTAKPPSNVGFTSFNKLGLCDLAFSRGHKYRIGAASQDGRLYLWDMRSGRKPTTSMAVPGLQGALTSLQFSHDEQIVYAGSEGGCIHGWDLRGGSQGAFMRAGEHYHRPICRLVLSELLQKLSSLRSQTDIEASAIHSLAFNPSNPKQLAFHLNNGWSGVVDTISEKITHAYCPPPPWQDGLRTNLAWTMVRRRRPAWLPTGSVFCVPSSFEASVTFLDFTAHPHARCWVDGNAGSPQVDESQQRDGAAAASSDSAPLPSWAAPRKRSLPSKTRDPPCLQLIDSPASITVHPLYDELVVGTQAGTLILIGTQGRPTGDREENTRDEVTRVSRTRPEDDEDGAPNAVSVSEGRIVFQYAAGSQVVVRE